MYPEKDAFINIHSHHKPRLKNEFVIRNAYLPNYALQPTYGLSFGLHPWFIHQMSLKEMDSRLNQLAQHPHLMAVGEIGLDRVIKHDMLLQKKYFEAQLAFAESIKRPVILHAVNTYYEFVPYLKQSSVPFIFHQFNGNIHEAEQLLKYNAYLSFGKNLFDFRQDDVLRVIPNGRFFLETDTLHHVHIADVYLKASEIRKTEVHTLKDELFNTFVQVFGKTN